MIKIKTRSLYLDIASQANGPSRSRTACIKGRDGVRKIPRRYHLQSDEIVQLKKEMQEKKSFISPYGNGRIYSYIIESLILLGTEESHLFSTVYDKFVEIASAEATRDKSGQTLWDRFDKREARNQYTARDARGKFSQNIEVLQRLGGDHPYGLKLAQVGACIDILVDENQQVKIQLRIGIADGDPVRPVNMNRKRSYTKTVDSVPSGVLVANSSEVLIKEFV